MRVVDTKELRVGIEQWGDPGGSPVVALHGFPDDARAWSLVAPGLVEAGHYVVAPYLRGVGPTTWREAPVFRGAQQAALARDVVELMDALGLRRAILAGHDWGALAACGAAILAPERVSGLVVTGGYLLASPAAAAIDGEIPSPAVAQALWYQWFFCLDIGKAALRADPAGFARQLWRTWSPGFPGAEAQLSAVVGSFANPDFAELVAHFYRHRRGLAPGDPARAKDEGLLASRPVIEAPVVVLHGAADATVPPGAPPAGLDRFAQLVAADTLEDVGHFPHRERPQAVIDAVARVREHLDGVRQPPARSVS